MLIKELKKIRKLISVKFLTYLNLLMLSMFIFKESNKTNFFDFYFNTSLDLYNVILFFNILTYVIIGEILSEEYKKGPLDYQVIKYKNIVKVISNKLLATFIFVLIFLSFDILIIFCFGIQKNLEPYQIFDASGLVILNDSIVLNSWLRFGLYNIDLLFGIAMTVILSGLVATFSNNKITSILGSFIANMFLTYPIPGLSNTRSIIFYRVPIINVYLEIYDYIKYFQTYFSIYIFDLLIGLIIIILLWRKKYEL
ncbi:hypothetical protein O6R05_05165 [Peptoniphilus equinus]|uniref:ABC-2 family transporter protein n=1 Tax=Peptoniphilus equinus TaxID=3016343 RepID=A0ABY7QRH9_9FIRM|nr:hypothetical protein [Peptoniphilus equinus]WBW49401.1 hypothetical protein O6R05_05165 [Peptoniphilus equinus]